MSIHRHLDLRAAATLTSSPLRAKRRCIRAVALGLVAAAHAPIGAAAPPPGGESVPLPADGTQPQRNGSAGDGGCRRPDEPPEGALAWPSCDDALIEVKHPIRIAPNGALGDAVTRRTLDAVARLLEERQDWLLVRVEGYSSLDPGPGARGVRRETLRSQRRADAVLRDLWLRGGVWAERLEAIGYGFRAGERRDGVRWPVVLRVVQRSRQEDDPGDAGGRVQRKSTAEPGPGQK